MQIYFCFSRALALCVFAHNYVKNQEVVHNHVRGQMLVTTSGFDRGSSGPCRGGPHLVRSSQAWAEHLGSHSVGPQSSQHEWDLTQVGQVPLILGRLGPQTPNMSGT